MIRRAFIRMFSGAVFATALGVKVETWKLEDALIGPVSVGGRDSEASGMAPGIEVKWSEVSWTLQRGGEEYARGVGMTPKGDGFVLHTPDGPDIVRE